MHTLTANWNEVAEHYLLATPSINHCLYAAGLGRSKWIGVFDADEVIVPHRYAYTYPEWLTAYERRKGQNVRLAHITFRNAYFFNEVNNSTKLKMLADAANTETGELSSKSSLPIGEEEEAHVLRQTKG